MRRAQTYEEAFKEIVRLQAGRLKGQTPDNIKGRLTKALGDITQDKDAKFAIAAFADEAARSRGPEMKGWEDLSAKVPIHDLSSSLFGVANSGTGFYTRWDDLEKKGGSDAKDILEIYVLCVLLGFKGGKADALREAVRQKTLDSVKANLGDFGLLLAESDLLAKGNPIPARRGFTLANVLMFLAALVYILALAHLSNKNEGIHVPPVIQEQ